MAKRLKDNTPEETKPTRVFIEYRDMFTFRMTPISPEGIEKVAQELLDWAMNNNDALKVTQFYHKKGLSGTTVARWKELSPSFNEAHGEAKAIIGNRREIGGLKKDFDSGIVRTSMPIYDKSWRKNEEWRSTLNKEKPTEGGTKIIIMEKYGSEEV